MCIRDRVLHERPSIRRCGFRGIHGRVGRLGRGAGIPARSIASEARIEAILISWKTLLRPHVGTLALGLLAVVGETIADLLQPWTLKIVFDNVLKTGSLQGRGWLNHLILETVGSNRLAILRFAAVAALAIAVAGAICSYWEKYLTTSVGQWVMHDLRRTLYSHVPVSYTHLFYLE